MGDYVGAGLLSRTYQGKEESYDASVKSMSPLMSLVDELLQ